MHGSLPTRLRVLRAERGLSLRQAAAKVGIRAATLSDIERGATHPHDVTLAKIARAYAVPVEDLFALEASAIEAAAAGKAAAPIEAARTSPAFPDWQQWRKILADVRARQRKVEAKAQELVDLDRSLLRLYQVRWVLDEAQDCALTLMEAIPGSHRARDNITISIPLYALDLDRWEEAQKAWRFYDDVVKRLVGAGLVELQEQPGQRAKPVPVGSGVA